MAFRGHISIARAATSLAIALVLAFAAAMLVLPCGPAFADESPEGEAPAAEEVVATPAASYPGSQIERVDDDHVVLRTMASIGVGEESRAVRGCAVALFVLLDAKGGVFQHRTVTLPMLLSPGSIQAIQASFDLSPKELEKADSLVFSCWWAGEPQVTLASHRWRTFSLDALKASYAEREEERKRQEHIDQWRERFPVDDYSNTLLLGDSIMQNTQNEIRAALPGVVLDADAGRTLEAGGLVFENESPDAGILDHVRHDDGAFERYVIQTGNNDGGGMPLEAAEEIVSLLGPGKEIYFVTMMSTRNQGATHTTNESIAAVVEEHPNVHAIDWHGLVEGRESEYLKDTCHPRKDRYADYAAFIKEGLDTVY